MTKEMLVKCIGFASQAGDIDAVTELTNELNSVFVNPAPEKKHRKPNNVSGYVAFSDKECTKEVARYQTQKEANIAMNKKESASNISDACRAYQAGKSNKAWDLFWKYGSDC